MNIIVKYVFLALALLYINSTSAGEVDLQIELDIPETNSLIFGEVIHFSITITNHGPDEAAGSSTGFKPNAIFIGEIFENNGYPELVIDQDTLIVQECFLVSIFSEPPPIPGAQGSISYLFSYPILPANQSITCYGIAQVFLKQGEKQLYFTAGVHQLDTDPNLANNSIDVIFGIKPQVIPTLNLWSLGLLFILVLIFASFVFNNNKKTNNIGN